MRPGRFGINVIARNRRNAAPIVYARLEHQVMIVRVEIRRNLNVHLATQNEACRRNGARNLHRAWFCATRHSRAGLGSEILNDDFLNMAVGVVQLSNCKQAVDALLARFVYYDQDALCIYYRMISSISDYYHMTV